MTWTGVAMSRPIALPKDEPEPGLNGERRGFCARQGPIKVIISMLFRAAATFVLSVDPAKVTAAQAVSRAE